MLSTNFHALSRFHPQTQKSEPSFYITVLPHESLLFSSFHLNLHLIGRNSFVLHGLICIEVLKPQLAFKMHITLKPQPAFSQEVKDLKLGM